MSFPGVGLAFMLVSAAAAALYVIYQNSTTRQQHYVYNSPPASLRIERDIYRPRSSRRGNFSNICCICIEEMCDNIKELNCNHCFHAKCIEEWFGFGNLHCPICRRTVR